MKLNEELTSENASFVKEMVHARFGPPVIMGGVSTLAQPKSVLKTQPMVRGEWSPGIRLERTLLPVIISYTRQTVRQQHLTHGPLMPRESLIARCGLPSLSIVTLQNYNLLVKQCFTPMVNQVRSKGGKLNTPRLRHPIWFVRKERAKLNEELTSENASFVKEMVHARFGPPVIMGGVSTLAQPKSVLKTQPMVRGEWSPGIRHSGLAPKKILSRFLVSPEAAIQPGTPLVANHFKVGDIVDVHGFTWLKESPPFPTYYPEADSEGELPEDIYDPKIHPFHEPPITFAVQPAPSKK
ncbi:hypothetical protein B566_EDAN005278 [Ephemera danica]|nr:hypothetical protein B566_EDAN005278 [Ephemera danica]